MRIVYLALVETDISNACAIHTREIVENLSVLGHELTIVLPRPLKIKTWKNVEHQWVRFWGFDPPRRWTFFGESVLRIFLTHRQRRYDLLYLRETEHTPLLMPFLRLTKIPLFVEVNGWLLDDLHQKGADPLRIAEARVRQQLLFKAATGIIVSTAGNAVRLANFYGISKKRICVQELGCNTVLFRPGDREKSRRILDLPLNGKLILFAGSFHHHHDLETLLQAFACVRDRHPESFLILLGTGPQFKSIQRKIERQRLSDHVILPGVRPYEEMPVWFQAADIAVLPLKSENIRQRNGCITLKLWEYMAAGLPVVATDFPDTTSAKFLRDRALVVPPEDERAIRLAILRLLENPTLCGKFSVFARNYVLKHRSWNQAARETADFIMDRLRVEQ